MKKIVNLSEQLNNNTNEFIIKERKLKRRISKLILNFDKSVIWKKDF